MKEIDIEKFKEALPKVLDSLLTAAREERSKSEPYKDLFGVSEHGLLGLLDQANDQMTEIVLNVTQAIEERTGKDIKNELFWLIQCLPFFRDIIERHISANDGWICSVDKARKLAGDFALSQLVEKGTAKKD